MSYCRFYQTDSLSGTFESPIVASRGEASSVQFNATPGATYDLKLQISNDGVNFLTYVGSELSGLDSSTPEGASVIYAVREPYRFFKLVGEILTGTPDVEGYLR